MTEQQIHDCRAQARWQSFQLVVPSQKPTLGQWIISQKLVCAYLTSNLISWLHCATTSGTKVQSACCTTNTVRLFWSFCISGTGFGTPINLSFSIFFDYVKQA